MSGPSPGTIPPQPASHPYPPHPTANGFSNSQLAPSHSAPSLSSSSASPSPAPPASSDILASWSPEPANLQHVFSLLRDPVAGTAGSQAHYRQLEALQAYPEFSYYLAYILALCVDEPTTTRSKAGLQLKNVVKARWEGMTRQQQEFIKQAVISSMQADDQQLRSVVGNVIAAIAVKCRIAGWPGILQHLCSLLDHPSAAVQDSAFSALSKVCEDIPKELIRDNEQLERPLHFLIPKFISFFHHPTAAFRIYALQSVNVFLYFMPLAMTISLEQYMSAVFVLAKQDGNKEVRRRVCQGLVILVEHKAADRPLQRHMDGVISFMLHCWPEADTRVLTNRGLLFLDQIEQLQEARKEELLFGCYDEQSQALLYSRGRLVFPEQPPPYLVEFTSAGEDARWAEESGDYGTEGVPDDSSSHVSLRVTPDHDMYVQLGRLASGDSEVVWSSRRRGKDVKSGVRPSAVPKPHSKERAWRVLSRDPREHVRMLACAEAGYVPQDTSQRRAVQRDLQLDDRQFAAFIELLGFWLGDGSLHCRAANGSVAGYVTFSQVRRRDLSWLRRTLQAAGLKKGEHWLTSSNGSVTALHIKKPTWAAFFHAEFSAKYTATPSRSSSSSSSSDSPSPSLLTTAIASRTRTCCSLEEDPDLSASDGGTDSSCPSEWDDHPFDVDSPVWEEDDPPVRKEKDVMLLPVWTLQELSKDEIRRLIRGLHRADGALAGGKNEIFTSSPAFRDQLMQALLHCGYSAYAGLDTKAQRDYRPVKATADGWTVSWAEMDRAHSSAAADSCWPSMSRQQCVQPVPYDAQRDGRTWCVEVEHPDHLIIAQRAHRLPDGTVSKQSRPIVAGNCCLDEDESVALEAAEFWSAYCDQERADMKLLAKYLQPLTATLVKGMRYSEEEISALDDEDDAQVPDRQQDIRPSVHRAKTVRYEGTVGAGSGGGGSVAHEDTAASGGAGGGSAVSDGGGRGGGSSGYGDEYDDDDGDDDDDDGFYDDDDDDEDASQWNLRKCSAAALDTLANSYGSLLFQHLLPLLKELLSASATPAAASSSSSASSAAYPELWVLRESAILALGAVAEGCFDAIQPHLHELIPYLLSFLQDKKPLVRSITCWTLSRYSRWVVLQAEGERFFTPLLEGLLASVLDGNKKVQEAACSAFATFEEEAGSRLQPHLARILHFLMHAFRQYQQRNMLILYDAIGTLAESVGAALNAPDCITILMPPLMQRWHDIPDDDRAIFPLFECLTSVSTALGPGFLPYATPVFQRCLRIIQRTLQQQQQADAANAVIRARGGDEDEMEYVDSEFIVCALDLLSGLAEGLEGQLDSLLSQHPQLLQLLYDCMQDRDPDVRQSSFALLGDLAKVACPHLLPHLHYFLPLCASNLNPAFSSVCNNASWSIGELAIKAGAAPLAPHIDHLMRNLIVLISPPPASQSSAAAAAHKPVQASLLENAAITIGRLGLVCPQQVSARLSDFCRPWFVLLAALRENPEKEHAYHGLCSVVELNPGAVLPDLPGLVRVIAGWRSVDNSRMVQRLGGLLLNFKAALEAQGDAGRQQWQQVINSSLDAQKREVISSLYGV